MVYDNKTTIVNVTVIVNSLFWTARPAHTLASRDEISTKEWSYKWTLFSTFTDDAVYTAQGVFHFEACMRENWNNNYSALLCKG